ncbi:helix-turn-helix domain-containing protein [Paramicrobacterium agarici]|uniref:helix-turn-helix domain-containing protein n=1 Tax=Paramicrobacterium agarici TaxID=630514 RepID=UPI00116F6950|nr:helix-turn-helix domain-containing protein [Microbacterium agarici]TQO22885.1 hypothetical protein FB385_1727 [Microbacterium agarici]
MSWESMMSVRTLDAIAERDGKWWVFELPELGTGGQAHNLEELDLDAQDVAAMWLNVPPDSIAVTVTVKGPDNALSEWVAAERDEEDARAAQSRAAARRRSVVRELRAQKYSVRDIARVLGISKQRVYQLEKS